LEITVNMNEAFEALRGAVGTITAMPEIQTKEDEIGRLRRLSLTRQLPDGSTRYMELKHVPPDEGDEHPFPMYAVLFGAYGNPDRASNFDARQWGDLDHIVRIVRSFMVDLEHQDNLPLFVPPEGMFGTE
jgi:hypothetical protein